MASGPAFSRRIDGLQWARGCAALLVVVCHAIAYPLPETPPFARLLGEIGVTIFFVISGFIMTLTTGTGRFDVGLFMRRRLIRVVPLYYMATLGVVFAALAAPELMKTTRFDAGHLVTSLLFWPSYEPATGSLLPIYKLGWTLNFEMFFYAVFAVLGRTTLWVRAAVITVAFAALAIVGQTVTLESAPLVFYSGLDILAFVAGVLIGLVRLHHQWQWPPLLSGVGMLTALTGAIVVHLVWGEMRVSSAGHLIGIAASALMVIVLVNYEDGGGGALSRLGILLGYASYALYLSHIFVVGAVWWLVFRLVGQAATPDVIVPTAVVIVILASAVAIAIHLWIERPVTDRLNARFASPRRPSGAARS